MKRNRNVLVLVGSLTTLHAAAVNAAQLDFRLMPQSAQPREWHQHGYNAQRTSYTPYSVAPPWRWQWSWNGSDANGAVVSNKMRLPRCVQPVTGGGRIYVACGTEGVVAINPANGSELWRKNPGGSIRSTVAYDPVNNSLFAYSSNGYLYKLNPATGATLGSFNTGTSSDLPLPPCVISGRVFVSSGTSVFSVNPETMSSQWSYNAGSTVQTPPSYSASRDRVIVCTADLHVHAIDASNGTRKWRVKPSVSEPGEPNEFSYGWPVIAENHGLVLVRMRLDWNLLWIPGQEFDTTNARIRAMLTAHPEQQCHFALDLDDGTVPFICNNGQGGYGDGGYLPLGSMPVVKTFSDGKEVVYNIIRGELRYDTRWDSHFGEMMLDDTTVPGFAAGEVRWIRHGNEGGENAFLLTDEQPFVSMAGDHLFGLHWLIGYALRITDRSSGRGTYGRMIETENLPWVICSQGQCGLCQFSSTHYCADGLAEDPTCGRTYAGGFYVCYNQGTIHDEYWGEYGVWVVSDDMVLCRTNDGAVACLRSGNPETGMAKVTTTRTRNGAQPAVLPHTARYVRISPENARVYAGKTVEVEGRIAYVFNNGKSILLGFAYPHQGVCKVQIPKRAWPAFTGLGTTMGRNRAALFSEGDRIRVKGIMAWYQGDPTVYIDDPSLISFIK